MAALRGYLTTQEAAERLGLTVSYVCRLIHKGRLDAIRLGGKVLLVKVASVRAFKPRPPGRPRKNKRGKGGQ